MTATGLQRLSPREPGERHAVRDRPSGALIFRDGVAVFLGPGGVPVIFDHEGVEQFVADKKLVAFTVSP
jgi:carbamate kinase